MNTFSRTLFLLLFLSSSFPFTAKCTTFQKHCSNISCRRTGPDVRFPFHLLKNGQAEPARCGFPGFNLSCNNRSQTILNPPFSAPFTVSRINYVAQTIRLNDPHSCLPKRILHLNLTGLPFRAVYPVDFTFLNCSILKVPAEWVGWMTPIPCMSGANYTVVVRPGGLEGLDVEGRFCDAVATVSVPVRQPVFDSGYPFDPNEDLKLAWEEPECGPCEELGGVCGFKGDTGLQIGCSRAHRPGLSRTTSYGIILGLGLPGLVCTIGVTGYICTKVGPCARRLRHLGDAEFSASSVTLQSLATVRGLDVATIDSFPKTVLGDSRRMPAATCGNDGSCDGACPICLSEYKPKETLRTMPQCNHSFHASCVDEWLRMNATCPLCRNPPDRGTSKPLVSTLPPSSSSS